MLKRLSHSGIVGVFTVLILASIAFSAPRKALVRISRLSVPAGSVLEALPITVNLWTDAYYVATVEADRLALLDQIGAAYDVIDAQAWDRSYYVVS